MNGPLVWAIDEVHQPLYLFPRDCPRILIWATAMTTPADRARWLGEAPMVAFIERAWAERLEHAAVWRYALPQATFEDLANAGMWVPGRQSIRSPPNASPTCLRNWPHRASG